MASQCVATRAVTRDGRTDEGGREWEGLRGVRGTEGRGAGIVPPLLSKWCTRITWADAIDTHHGRKCLINAARSGRQRLWMLPTLVLLGLSRHWNVGSATSPNATLLSVTSPAAELRPTTCHSVLHGTLLSPDTRRAPGMEHRHNGWCPSSCRGP